MQIGVCDAFTCDGRNIYHFKRNRGLFKLGAICEGTGNDSQMIGRVKEHNTKSELLDFENVSMIYFDD
jgi:hypothetical protein